MKLVTVAVVLGLVLAAYALAGSTPVTATRVSAPSRAELGASASVTFALVQGKAPLAGAHATVIATAGAARTSVRARTLGRGRYAAVVRPSKVGRWSLHVRVRGATLGLGSLTVVRPRLVEAYKAIAEPAGTLVVADGGYGGGRLIRVDPRNGRRLVIAGDGGTRFAAAGKTATAASLGRVYSVARSPSGELHAVVDNRIVKLAGGRVRVVAGNGRDASAGDGGLAARATLSQPVDIEFAPNGDLFVTELGADRVRRIAASSGTITTVTRAGERPFKLAFAHDGSLLVTQLAAGRVYRIDDQGGVSTFLANVPVVSGIVRLPSSGYLLSQHPPEHGVAGDVVRLDADGTRTTIARGTIREPTSLARADDGTIYVTAFDPSLPLGRIDLTTGSITAIR